MSKSLITLEVKLHFESNQDKYLLIKSMREYSAAAKYGIQALKPKLIDKKEIYSILTEKFNNLPTKVIDAIIKQDVFGTANSFLGTEVYEFPPTMRFSSETGKFFFDGEKVKLKIAVHRVQKGEIIWIVTSIMPRRCLTYKYYKRLFTSDKKLQLPFTIIMRNGQIYAEIAVEKEKLLSCESKPHVNVGIDLNAFWIGRRNGHPLAVAFLNDDGTFARQPLLIKEWADIPQLIRDNQGLSKGKLHKVLQNQMGIIIKNILVLTKDYNPTFKIEELRGLCKMTGAYSKFSYGMFTDMLKRKAIDVQLVDPSYTSQLCSRCGKLGKAIERSFVCESCYPNGFHRDINAAINIAKRDGIDLAKERYRKIVKETHTPHN